MIPRPLPLRRYLTSFATEALPQRFTDVLVIGSGIAGLAAACAAAERCRVLLVSKGALLGGSTAWAQGGIAAAVGPDDSVEQHVRDTLEAGAGLCEEAVVRAVVGEGVAAVHWLAELGARFDRAPSGSWALAREGGHLRARVLHAEGDRTGREVARALLAAVRAQPRVQLLEQTFAIDVLTAEEGCCGALLAHPQHGREVVWAHAVVLATGGAGQLFRETTNPPEATGDGVAMALRAGAVLADLEFVQFHPTTLYVAGASRALITEAVRGEGGRLVDRQGRRFMPEVHPLAELAPRDIVARAIMRRMRESGDTQVYLDVTHLDAAHFRRRFPGIAALCDAFDIDFAHEPIPVRPTAHYLIGGIEADLDGRTAVPRLLACGECACTGFHGANRLGSNSLLEGVVVGRRAGAEAARLAAAAGGPPRPVAIEHAVEPEHHHPIDIDDLTRSLRAAAWFGLGVEREAAGLAEVRRRLRRWIGYALDGELDCPRGWELQNMLVLALGVARQAELRTESRGVHYRLDHPERDDARWRVHSRIRLEDLRGL